MVSVLTKNPNIQMESKKSNESFECFYIRLNYLKMFQLHIFSNMKPELKKQKSSLFSCNLFKNGPIAIK